MQKSTLSLKKTPHYPLSLTELPSNLHQQYSASPHNNLKISRHYSLAAKQQTKSCPSALQKISRQKSCPSALQKISRQKSCPAALQKTSRQNHTLRSEKAYPKEGKSLSSIITERTRHLAAIWLLPDLSYKRSVPKAALSLTG
ncbi:hypothetical protein [Anaerobiospirillum sp. NML120449]|uniref:hypothetical protein n=1 Tax=Anaerobiospirillum sp. NML120449 TaxID=2932817 RepID=UPI001FF3116A|nr:hypothetical protein [Anaerobiospirillum sp. NML120449]MCK0526666.1 hypothetical protein [Anaerobiospirillum sp. NML120449]